VAATAVREFVEELYGVHELETGDGRVDPQCDLPPPGGQAPQWHAQGRRCGPAVLRRGRQPARPAPRNLHGAGHRGSPLVRARERGAAICDEFLQQCEQAELLPDQRWVQLISLTRPGLEVEPMWWDRLRASTIVAPGAAAVELSLQVARAVVS
jgi:hypothetical protein